MSLYDISTAYTQLFDNYENMMADAAENGIPEEEAQEAWYQTLTDLEGEFDVKSENIACYIKNLTAEMTAIRAEEQELHKRYKSKEKKVESLKKYLLDMMTLVNAERIETAKCCIKTSPGRISLAVENEAAAIEALQRAGMTDMLRVREPELAKAEIVKYIKSGGSVVGCELVRKPTVSVK